MALFGAKEIKIDIVPDVVKDLANFHKRTMFIEKDFYTERMTITRINDSIVGESNTFLSELKDIRESVSELRSEIDHLKLSLRNTIGELKRVVTIDEVQFLKDRVDAWNPESFVTVKEADYVLRNAFKR